MRTSCILACCLLMASIAHAAGIDKPLSNATQEQTARILFQELRCMTCEGQTIGDSNATLAAQMREHVREQVTQGKSQAEVLTYFRARYGDQILMTPPMEQKTALLWLGPLLLLAFGAALVWRTTHHKKDDRA